MHTGCVCAVCEVGVVWCVQWCGAVRGGVWRHERWCVVCVCSVMWRGVKERVHRVGIGLMV